MSTAVGKNLRPGGKRLLMGAAAIGVVVIVAIVIALSRGSFRTKPAGRPVAIARMIRTVPIGKAGKAGRLLISAEALELAEIRIGPARERSVAETLEVSGVIEAGGDQQVKVTPRVPGKIVSLRAGVGDAVRAGQALGILESTELAAAQAACRQARSKVDLARSQLDRQRRLARLGVFDRPSVEDARTKIVAAQEEAGTARSAVDAARAAVEEAQSERQAARAALEQAQSQVEVSRSRFDRAELLLREQLISRQDGEAARADLVRSQSDVKAAQANVARTEAKIETERAGLRAAGEKAAAAERRDEIARQSLRREEAVYRGGYAAAREIVEAEAALHNARLELQAAAQSVRLLGGVPGGGNTVPLVTPIAGRVRERNVSIGETVNTEHALFTILSLDRVWAQLAIAPGDLPRVRPGQRVTLTADTAPDRSFTGAVSGAANTADETTRTVRIRVPLDNPGGLLRPGAFVRGRITTDVRRNRVTVPPKALQEHTGRPTVYVAAGPSTTLGTGSRPGAFEVRHVTLGIRGEGWREITGGLRAGERIATSGTFYLKSEALKSSLSDGCCAPGGGE